MLLLGGTLLWWPYGRNCGIGLAMYLAATAMIVVGGVWVAGCTWVRQMASAHVLAMVVLLWGLGLAADGVLPHVGYDKPDSVRPAAWACAGN